MEFVSHGSRWLLMDLRAKTCLQGCGPENIAQTMTSEPGLSVKDIDRLKLSIFQQDWWLNIARGSARLEEVQVHSPNGAVIGSLPYIVQHSALGVPSGGGAHLSHVIGPIVSKNLSDEEKSEVLGQLIGK